MTLKRKFLWLAVGVGLAFGALAYALPGLARHGGLLVERVVVPSVLPGMLLSNATANGVHGYSPWAGALGNFLFYFFLCWGVGQGGLLLLRSRPESGDRK